MSARPTTTLATERRARPRTCDGLGVCQQRAQPCSGCNNAHPAYHHLHRVHHAPAPLPTPACTADACQQGRAPCPAPQACHVPSPEREPSAHDNGLDRDPVTALEATGALLVFVALAAFMAWVIVWAAGA